MNAINYAFFRIDVKSAGHSVTTFSVLVLLTNLIWGWGMDVNAQLFAGFVSSIIDLDKIKLWHIRTESGKLFNEYVNQEYISLGWNYLTKSKLESTEEERLKIEISQIYDTSRPGTYVNQAFDFVTEMHEGDIVIFPSESSSSYCFAIIGEYFEEKIHEDSFKMERDFFKNEYEKNVESFGITNPYIKRRKIKVVKIIDSVFMPPQVRLILRNYGASMNLDEYKDVCLGLIFPYFWHKEKLYLNLVTSNTDPRSFDYGRLVVNVSKLFTSETSIRKEDIEFRANINSPGSTQFIIDLANFINSEVFTNQGLHNLLFSLLLVNLVIQGGRIEIKDFKVELPSFVSGIKVFRGRKTQALQNRNEFLEASIKNIDLEREFELRKKHYAASSEISDEDLSKISVLEQKGYTVHAPGKQTLLNQISEDVEALGIRAGDEEHENTDGSMEIS